MPNLFKELGFNKSSSWNNHWRGTDRPTMRFELFGINPEIGQWRWSKRRTYQAVENYKELISYIQSKEGDIEINDSIINKYYWKYLEENDILDIKDFELVRQSDNNKPEHYIPGDNEILLSENWMDIPVAGSITNFSHEKNEEILLRIFDWLSQEGDIVLDFFLGSGTTAAVAHKMKRQYIGIEQMEYGLDDPVNRLHNVINGEDKGISKEVDWEGGGNFVVCELSKWNFVLLDSIKNVGIKNDLKIILDQILKKGYLIYDFEEDEFVRQYNDFEALKLNDQKKFLCEILDKNDLYLNYSEIEDTTYNISPDDIFLNHDFYNQINLE